MKIGEILKKYGDHFNVDKLSIQDLRPFRDHLKQLGYEEKNVFSRLRVGDIEEITVHSLPVHAEVYLDNNYMLDRLIKLFILHRELLRPLVEKLFPKEILEFLFRIGILVDDEGFVSSTIDIYPCMGMVFATDVNFTNVQPPRQVYHLGKDSYALARALITDPVDSTLDLCTGSGVQGIIASRYSKKVICVDLNPRALNFTRFNALLNGVENVECRQGNLYETVSGMKFDRIISNPPFVPSPEDRLLFRDGSKTGEAVLQKIVAGLPQFLKDDGISQIYTLLVFTGGDYNEKVRSWLPVDPGYHILSMTYLFLDILNYIRGHVHLELYFVSYYGKLVNWMRSYQEAGIEKVAYGLINFEKAKNSKPTSKMIEFRPLVEGFSNNIKIILDAIDLKDRLADEKFRKEFLDGKFHLADGIDLFWEGTRPGNELIYGVAFESEHFSIGKELTKEEKGILEALATGAKTGREILGTLKKTKSKDKEARVANAILNLVKYRAVERE
jgi:hypothetical protein